jgi:quinol monooxygenase YgiN
MRVKPGQEKALKDEFDRWNRERGPKVKGAVASYVLSPEKRPGELLIVAIFQDRATYAANAQDPEQDRWYRRMREMLTADPEWTDGEIEGQTMKR